jgi:hypothetical protein
MEALLEKNVVTESIDDFITDSEYPKLIPDTDDETDDITLEPIAITENTEFWNDTAIFCMEAYFYNKSFHCGGPIPNKMLFSEKYITLVRDSIRTSSEGFGKVVEAIHELLMTHSPLRNDVVDTQKPWHVALVIKMFKDVHAYRVPREFVAPLVLLNLHFCKGYKITPEMLTKLLP